MFIKVFKAEMVQGREDTGYLKQKERKKSKIAVRL